MIKSYRPCLWWTVRGSVVLLLAVGLWGQGQKSGKGEDKSTGKDPAPAARPAEVPPEYRIDVGDVLQVSVWKEPEASVPAAQVRRDGKISLPFIKEVEIRGMTTTEAEAVITQRLGRLIRNPEVTVLVKEANSEKVYLLGAVRREGPVLMKTALTPLQAIAEAGGLTEFAKKKKIYILRNSGQSQVRLPFNYDAAIKGENKGETVFLKPGDTIVVPQ